MADNLTGNDVTNEEGVREAEQELLTAINNSCLKRDTPPWTIKKMREVAKEMMENPDSDNLLLG